MSLRDLIKLSIGGKEREVLFFLVSLFLAFLVWLFTNLSKDYSSTVNSVVIAQCNIDGRKGLSSNTAVVSARCRVDGFHLLRYSQRQSSKPVVVQFSPQDLRRTGPDTWSVSGSTMHSYVNMFFGEGAQVEAFITDTLSFVFPQEKHKRVPVEVPLYVQYRSQYMQSGRFKTIPDSVTVYGEDARLESIDHIDASRLNLVDVHESAHGILKLSHPKEMRISADEVSYELPVSRYVELSGTYRVEVWNAPAGHDVQVFPPVGKVIFHCAFPLIKDPVPQFKLYIDYKDFKESRSGKCVPKTVTLPQGVLDWRVEPEVYDCIELR